MGAMRKVCLIVFTFFVFGEIMAQVSLTNASPSVLIDFSNSTPSTVGTNPVSSYTASGFETDPITAGRLNSNAWAATGWSNGPLSFGGSQIASATDYTRGSTAIAVTTGGFYAFIGAPASASNPTFMIQPAAGDFEPGTLTLRIQNNGTDIITQLSVSYNLYIRNDQGRSNSFNFSYSTNDVSYTSIPALDYTSPVAADAFGWVLVGSSPSRSTVITGLNIAPGAFLYLRWSGADVGGAGSRDEFGLDDINVTATFTPQSTDYYRSVSSGNWNNASSWETSSDNITWIPAVLPPTYIANSILIRNGHTITVTTSVTVDQVVIENGGIVNHTAGTITVENGVGDDINIQSGGVLRLAFAGTPPAYGTGSPTINVSTGGILRVAAGGMTGAGTGVNINNIVYQHQSILEWAPSLPSSFSSGGVTYFPNAGPATIPIFRSNNSFGMQVGATANTVINGVFEAVNATVTWENSGTKTFRNGIRGSATIDGQNGTSQSGQFIINGTTAELGGTGGLILSTTNGMLIGSASGTTVAVSDNKVVTGNVSLVSTNTYVDLGTSTLTITGNIIGGTATSYIRTANTGALILNSIDATGKTFPVGHTTYNPVTITNGSNHNWTVNVNDGVVADPPNGITGAVLRTWGITPSVNPPAAGATLTFQFDGLNEVGTAFNTPPNNTPDNVQAWHRTQGYWLAAGTPVPLVNAGGNIRTATIAGLTNFSPYALSRISLPLPIKLLSFTASRIADAHVILNWELAACCSKDAKFEIQKSTNNRDFYTIADQPGSEVNRFYSYHDTRLSGNTYYRLKITEPSGKITYSPVAAILQNSSGLLITSLWPNPATDKVQLSISSGVNAKGQLILLNMAGQVVLQQNIILAEGSRILELELSHLSKGMYQGRVQAEGRKATFRLVKN